MRRNGLFAAVIALTMAWAAPANADDILFDPSGGGAGSFIDLLDPSPGNAIVLGISANSEVGDMGTVLYQANLSIASLDGSPVYANCPIGGTCFTFVAAIDVVVTDINGTIEFDLDPTGDTNVFKIYANTDPTDPGVNLTGQCFASLACGGTEIMSGTFETFVASFTGQPVDPELLDQFNDDDYGGVLTVVGGGAFDGNVVVDSHNAGYFPDLVDGMTIFLTGSEQSLPYDQADPSECFSSNAVANCDTPGVASVGAVNGLGNHTMLQTDQNISFEQPDAPIPEPASLLLLGSGLVGAAAARRRRRQVKK